MTSLDESGYSRGESLNRDVISKRQAFLDAQSEFLLVEEEFFRLKDKVKRAEQSFVDALQSFDNYYGVKK